MKQASLLGILASLFFAFTFVFNRQMNLGGGSFIWSASLRYIFMLPILFLILVINNQLYEVLKDIKDKKFLWILWSTVGFGFFYAPLTLAAEYGPSWLIAATWQLTIIAGILLSPISYSNMKTECGIKRVRNSIPKKALGISMLILLGVFLMQINESKSISGYKALIGVVFVIIGAISYPLGNRKMMEVCSLKLNTIQRVFGMTLCSMPFWIILSTIGIINNDIPKVSQIYQSIVVAIFSGIIATVLFFKATDMVKNNPKHLAAVESTQAGEVVFTLIGGVCLFNDKIPTTLGLIGLFIVVLGVILNSVIS